MGRPPANHELLDLIRTVAEVAHVAPEDEIPLEHVDDPGATTTFGEYFASRLDSRARRLGPDADVAKAQALISKARGLKRADEKQAVWLEPLREAAVELGLTSEKTTVDSFAQMLREYRRRAGG